MGNATWRERLGILLLALVPRLLVGALTFGSEDGVASLRNSLATFEGRWADTPYLPFIEVWIWTAGVVAYHTGIAVMLPYKLLPIAADVLIALLLHDAESDPKRGFRNGLLYALSPIAIWISAAHMQWDSLWIYFLLLALLLMRVPAIKAAALAGAALVLSVAAKPIAVPLSVVLLPLVRRRALAFIAGGGAMAAVYAGILASIGWLLTVDNLMVIGRYAQTGVQLFGLPQHPFNRLWTALAILAALWLLCVRRKLTREEAVLLFFSAVMGVAGLSPQYLSWLVAFAILAGRTRFLGVYTLLAGLFLVVYYRLPLVNRINVDNMGAYGLLRPLGAFSPAAAGPELRAVALLLGNYAIPLFCLGYVIYDVVRVIRTSAPAPQAVADVRPARYLLPAGVVTLLVMLAGGWARTFPAIDAPVFVQRIEQKITAQYDVVRYPRPVPGRGRIWVPRSVMEEGRANRVLHAANFAAVWVVAAAALTFFWRQDDAT